MSEPIDSGGPAFPVVSKSEDGHQCGESLWQFTGMTLRQWYAGMAMQGLVSSKEAMALIGQEAMFLGQPPLSTMASKAFEAADAMIAALKTKSE